MRPSGESGQATVESAWLIGALALGAFALGWPLMRALVRAWWSHHEAVQLPLRVPLP